MAYIILTKLAECLGAAFCGVWLWAEKHQAVITQARQDFHQRPATG